MRRTVTIALSTGAAVAMLGGGLAVASVRGDGSDDRARPAAASSSPAVRAPATTISRARAEQIALKGVPGGRVTSAEAEQEHGRTVWDVRIVAHGVRHDVRVDRHTGKVLRDRVGKGSGVRSGGGTDDPAGHDATDDRVHRGNAAPSTTTHDDAPDDNGHHAAGDDHGRHGGSGRDDGHDDGPNHH